MLARLHNNQRDMRDTGRIGSIIFRYLNFVRSVGTGGERKDTTSPKAMICGGVSTIPPRKALPMKEIVSFLKGPLTNFYSFDRDLERQSGPQRVLTSYGGD
jgi:hypothetical protein